MKLFKTLVATAILATGTLATTMPAQAAITTFASYTALGTAANIEWKKSGTANGSVFTLASPTATTAGSVGVTFNFLQPLLASLGNLSAVYTLSGTSTNTPATLLTVGSSAFLVQTIVSGSFSFIYSGTSPLVVGGVTYLTGANLLSATFTNAAIFGQNGATSGSLSGSTEASSLITYTSDFLNFGATLAQDFSVGLTSMTPTLTRTNANASLTTFKASSGGAFSTDPAPIVSAIPEPDAWALLLVGFGLVGLQVRRRNSMTTAVC